ncbi:MAG TPA: efflux RND transporter permease subunit [Chthoniobacterales bacterium]|nr:efflux RND transporter permease subunit [Chthoniobacterales bacterium]
MWIVNLALRRPYTFIVLSIFILIAGVLSILSTPKDIFPSINIPVISVIWTFTGMAPEEVEQHITSPYERVLTTTVDNIEHIESQSLNGIAVVKIFLQPNASVPAGIAQVTSVSQAVLKQLPNGITPPLVLSYSATNVPVINVGLSSKTLSEQQLNDYGLNFVRTQLITVPGAAIPYPYGGKQRYVEVDLDYKALQGYGLTPADVVNTINAQNLILPSGTQKIGRFEYQIGVNASPPTFEQLNAIPIKTLANGTTIYMRDVARILNGNIPQTNIVRFNGTRSTMLVVQKTGSASTLDIVQGIKDKIPRLKQTLPPALDISTLSDQSIFVTGAIDGVVRETVIAACLTAIMILLFLGDWKSTLIIAISIPLAILSSIAVLSALGQTLNIMTLGGLALAVGILVDDATVTIENIDRHLAEGKPTLDAIRDGAAQIAVPALVSTMCICIVFIPIFFLSGVAKYLFSPLAEAVIFAMIASYILSRTLVPTLAMYWIRKHGEESHQAKGRKTFALFTWFSRFHRWFNNQFEKFREGYRDLLSFGLRNAGKLVTLVLGFTVVSMGLFPFLGQNFFPSVDSGQFDMHVRVKSGTRIEETARSIDQIEQMIRQVIPANQLHGIIDNLGIPYSGINISYNTTGTMSPADGDILVSLNENHDPTNKFVQVIRTRMHHDFPDVGVWFPPADIVAQVLNFGLSAPIDIQITGANKAGNFAFASKLMDQIRHVPGAVDFRIQEPNDAPQLNVTIDRTLASVLGVTAQAVSNSVLGALAGSNQTSPNFWVDPTNRVSYQVNAQVPQYDMDSLDSLRNLPILGGSNTGQAQILANAATISRGTTSPVVDHYNITPVINIYGNVDGKDLGYVADQIQKLVDASKKDLPRGSFIDVRGQVSTMHDSFVGLYLGLAFSMVLVYLLMVVNFQSWTEPFIIITALPCALAGIVWMLFTTGTTLSVPALMGAIMCMGVATANSVLVVTFANELLEQYKDSYRAALEAGYARLRPVLMTAMAMIIGMIPMALGLGEGGEQNAPLGRAVIGGLIFATVATLFFVPTVFMIVRRGRHSPSGESSPQLAVGPEAEGQPN